MPPFSNIQPLTVIFCVVTYMMLGFLWYSSLMFGDLWLRLTGLEKMNKEQQRRRLLRSLFLSLFSGTVMAMVLSMLFFQADIGYALLMTAFLWLAFNGMMVGTTYAFSARPFLLWLIDSGFPLTSMLLMSAIITQMPKP